MAGHVPKRVLRQPEVDKILLEGTTLHRWEEGDPNLHKLDFYADKDAFFLYARADDTTRIYDSFIWDISLISDIRPGKLPKDPKLLELMTQLTGGGKLEDHLLTLVYRRDGIVNVDFINMVCEVAEAADKFKRAVNALTFNMLHAHAPPCRVMYKNYVKIKLHSNGYGHIPLKHINRLMMIRYTPDNYINRWLMGFNIVKTSKDDGSKYIKDEDFTEDIFLRMVDQILNNRINDIDVVLGTMTQKARKGVTLTDFHKFLNNEQRDPRLNEILYPLSSKEQAKSFITRHERGKYSDRLTAKGLMEYLMCEENNILDVVHLDQDNDMNQPMNHYFVNSSHNTYLTGHQLKSASTTEMYIQALLLGCRCVELDCWPTSDGEDITITHGGTLCGKVSLQVVEAINEFAFVTSEYPVILSIENHCKSRANLIQRMTNIFVTTFGDKLVKSTIDGYPLEPGVPLPSPERLKGKILLKDKVKRQKGSSAQFDTLTRGLHVPTSLDEIPEENGRGEEKEKEEGEPNSTEERAGTGTPENDPGVEQKEETRDITPEQPKDEETKKPKEVVQDKQPSGEEGEGKTAGEEGSKFTESVEERSFTAGENCEENDDSKSSKKIKAFRLASFDSDTTPTPTHKKSTSNPDFDDMAGLVPPRHVEVEAHISGPLVDLLNYCTGISFEGFPAAEKLNCSFYMSSFVEEKGLNFIKTQAKDYVKYNMRQFSRIYPQGNRFNSSNYMPQIFWNVGCQLVALNYQTSDLPLQLNHAKFEFNGATGYILKPWVMLTEKTRGGAFNPFTQSKLEDIVPAKLSIKIISGLFLTRKNTNCYVEAEMYGLPADTVRHKYYTRKVQAPHPFWDDETFMFKRILLPEMAMLRVVVFDDDREMIGQRFLPVNAIRPGFRHIPLRDKHNQPLPLAMLFVKIKVEDWVPNNMEDVVASLMDPISFASKALEDLAMGEFEEENGNTVDAGGPASSTPSASDTTVLDSSQKSTPKHVTIATSDLGMPLPLQLPASGSSLTLSSKNKSTTLPASASFAYDETLPCLEKAKQRKEPMAVVYDSKVITDHPEYKKLCQKLAKNKATIVKKQEKLLKSAQDKLAKSKKPDKTIVKDLQEQQRAELLAFERKAITERHEKQRSLLEFVHSVQLKDMEKMHKEDLQALTQDLGIRMKTHRKGSDASDKRAAFRDIEEQTISLGKKTRNEFSKVHQQERTKLQDKQKETLEKLTQVQQKELASLEGPADEATAC